MCVFFFRTFFFASNDRPGVLIDSGGGRAIGAVPVTGRGGLFAGCLAPV